jgi:hypothetical protein
VRGWLNAILTTFHNSSLPIIFPTESDIRPVKRMATEEKCRGQGDGTLDTPNARAAALPRCTLALRRNPAQTFEA